MGDARVSQLPIESLIQSDAPIAARVSQLPIEILIGLAPTTIARLDQAPLEVAVLADAPIDVRVDQLPLELLVFPVEPRWRLLINGVDQTAIVEALSITWTLNERARASIVVGDLLPARYADVVVYAADGVTPLFGGLILQRHYEGRTSAGATFTARLDCGDYFAYADASYATLIYDQVVTLKTVLQDLVTDYLGAFGIVLYPSQVDGPTLEPFLWRNKRLSDAIRELGDRTGYVAQITPAKTFRMFLPGTDAAPFTLTEAAPHCRELSWTDRDQEGLGVNKVRIIAGPNGQREVHDEHHYGDGVTRIFPLYAPFQAMIGALSLQTDVEAGFGGQPVGIYGVDDMAYTYDVATNAIRQRADQPVLGPAEVDTYFTIWYFATFPFEVSASTGATPVLERLEARPDVLSIPAAQEIATGLLAQLQSGTGGDAGESRELEIATDVDGLVPGQALVVDLPTLRGVSGTFLVTDVSLSITFDRVDDRLWRYRIAAVESTAYQGSYLDDWRRVLPSVVTAAADAPGSPPARVAEPRKKAIGGARYLDPGTARSTVFEDVPPAE